MAHPEYQYLQLMAKIMKEGKTKPTRGIHGIKCIFGHQLRFDMRHGFPLLTTKKLVFSIMLRELFWFISGDESAKYLHEHNVHFWDGFLDEEGNLGRVYGVQWRHWRRPDGTEFDQLQWAIDEIKNNPDSKAIIVSAWNAGELKEMRLPPCHTMFQFDVTKGKLRLHLYQRSSDVFLGLPFNIAQYSLILHMVAHLTNTEPRELIISIGNAHLYTNHIEPAKEQLRRKPLPFPKLTLRHLEDVHAIDDFDKRNFKIVNYEAHDHIKADLVIL